MFDRFSLSPRAPPSRSSEPATEDDADDQDDNDDAETGSSSSFASINSMQKQLTQMLADVTRKSQKQMKRSWDVPPSDRRWRYNNMRSNVTEKDDQITRLHATYGNLTQQVAELQSLCDSDMNLETLDRLFRSIPRHEQLSASDSG